MPQYRDLADLFARLGIAIGSAMPAEDALAMVTAAAVEAMESVDAAGITVVRNGAYETVAATSDLVLRVDAIQYELAHGPCVDAIQRDTVLRSDDLRTDPRWPDFAERAVPETGVRSMLSSRMYFEEGPLVAGMNFYATSAGAFDDATETTGLVLSTHAALTLVGAIRLERIENLERALQSNRDIGVAMGILMARHFATRDQAFDLLKIASQHTHRKLADIAEDVIQAGDLEFPGPGYRQR